MELLTERCQVRPFQLRDIEAFMTYRNDLDWMRYQGFKGLSYEAYISTLLDEFDLTTGGQLAIIHRASDTLIGDLYVLQVGTSYWIGFAISPTYARQGYAQEVVSELIRSLKKLGANEILAGAHRDNMASQQLLKKLGFRFVEMEHDDSIYRFDVTAD